MCIVIDTNTLGPVFEANNADHNTFKPVHDWIFDGQGMVVYGGSKYLNEIGKYGKIFKILKDANKAVFIDSGKVDALTTVVSQTIVDPDFDDQHIVSLLLVSGCKLICSNDKRAYPFFQHKSFFKAKHRPRIYHTLRGISLLDNKYIANICLPCRPTTNQQKQVIQKGLNI